MSSYILLSEKSWHNQLFSNISSYKNSKWIRIKEKDKFNLEELDKIKPKKIFIPHWSHIIPANIFEKYECIVFHMTDLPFGRGGSPLQNLIVRRYNETKISAIKVVKEIDAGDVYLKRSLSLDGSAIEIFKRSTPIIEEMIKSIIDNDVKPVPQEGVPVIFKRRKPSDSNIDSLSSLQDIYDYIRMLDCEGYPNAFLENHHFRLEFSRAKFIDDQIINADVRIIKK
jgi:methionyl-tRNA formyltransferase